LSGCDLELVAVVVEEEEEEEEEGEVVSIRTQHNRP
jgi:hypothetical protein